MWSEATHDGGGQRRLGSKSPSVGFADSSPKGEHLGCVRTQLRPVAGLGVA